MLLSPLVLADGSEKAEAERTVSVPPGCRTKGGLLLLLLAAPWPPVLPPLVPLLGVTTNCLTTTRCSAVMPLPVTRLAELVGETDLVSASSAATSCHVSRALVPWFPAAPVYGLVGVFPDTSVPFEPPFSPPGNTATSTEEASREPEGDSPTAVYPPGSTPFATNAAVTTLPWSVHMKRKSPGKALHAVKS